MEFIPPPEGLNIDEIATEAGLFVAIQREAEKLHNAKNTGARVSKDTIRLIVFLAGEIRRRIDNLSPEEKIELQRLRDTAEERELERKSEEITINVNDFIRAVNEPGVAVRLSEINELEDQALSMMRLLGEDPEKFAALLDTMMKTLDNLLAVKNKGTMLGGLPDF